jgi:hypothetical protein
MANLVELSNQLEDFPEQQLVQMSQDPNSMYPSYLVLSEIQRRNQMRKMYEAQQPKPETTVAEEVIGEFAGQQGLQGAMAQSPGPQDAFPPSDMGNMAPPSPMQMMASGGLTGYDEGGKTKFPLLEAKSKVTKEQNKQILNKIADARLEKFGVAGKMSNLGDRAFSIMGGSGNNIRLNPTEEKLYIQLANEMIDKKASGGRTGYNLGGSLGLSGDSLSQTFINPMENQLPEESSGLNLFGEDGLIFDPNNPLDYLVFVPGLGLVSKGVSSAYKGSKILSKAAKTQVGKQKLKTDPTKRFGQPNEKGLKPLRKTEEIGAEEISRIAGPITRNPYKSSAVGLYGTSKVADAVSDDEQIVDVEPNIIENPATIRTSQESARKTVSEDIETGRKGLGNFLPNADPTALIGLGGAIMGANTIGELGKGISEVALGERARKDALQMSGLKGRLTEAQIRKYEADVANMDANQIISEMNAINKGVESGAIQIDEELQAYVSSLRTRLQQMRSESGTGFVASETPTGGDVLAKNKVA